MEIVENTVKGSDGKKLWKNFFQVLGQVLGMRCLVAEGQKGQITVLSN